LNYTIPATDLNTYTVRVVAASDDGSFALTYSFPAQNIRTYNYDGRNGPVSENTNAQNTTWTLDALGRVVGAKTTDWKGTTVADNAYGYDDQGDSRVSETTIGQSSPSAIYIDDPLGLLKTISGTSVAYDYYNGHGDVVQTDDATGNDIYPSPLIYDEFGNPTGINSPRPYGWTGRQERDTSQLTGVIRMGVRLYDPTLGRFLSVDPVEGGSLNNYDYAGQDPVNGSDLNGTMAAQDETYVHHYSARFQRANRRFLALEAAIWRIMRHNQWASARASWKARHRSIWSRVRGAVQSFNAYLGKAGGVFFYGVETVGWGMMAAAAFSTGDVGLGMLLASFSIGSYYKYQQATRDFCSSYCR
jgi:RHS repeat-associated protein